MEILIQGCKHYGVDQSHIEYLASLPYTPRKLPHEFRTLHTAEELEKLQLPLWTREQVEEGDGKEGRPIYYTINGKVRTFIGDPRQHPRDYEWYLVNYAGRPMEMFQSRVSYDPKYGIHDTIEEYSREHCAYIEDIHASKAMTTCVTIALIRQVYCD